jgi:hypothetical protein
LIHAVLLLWGILEPLLVLVCAFFDGFFPFLVSRLLRDFHVCVLFSASERCIGFSRCRRLGDGIEGKIIIIIIRLMVGRRMVYNEWVGIPWGDQA